MEINQLTSRVIRAAINVHQQLGPGLLESVYQQCMMIELQEMGHRVEAELSVPIRYKGKLISQEGLRLDLLVEERVIVEIKSVEEVKPVHKKQLLTYLRLMGKSLGLLINFNVPYLRHGIERIIDGDPFGGSMHLAEDLKEWVYQRE